jgi:hypothetical protein
MCDTKSFPQDNPVQKSPKGATEQLQHHTGKRRATDHITIQVTDYIHTTKGHQTSTVMCDTKSFPQDNPVQKSPKGAAGQLQHHTGKRRATCHITIQVTDYIHTAKGHQTHRTNNTIAPSTTARQVWASHILHRLNLMDNARLPIIKQHHFQFLTLKQVPQIPLNNTRPKQRGHQVALDTSIYTKTGSLQPHPTVPTTSRTLANTMLRHPTAFDPCTSRRIQRFAHLQPRRRLHRGHI